MKKILSKNFMWKCLQNGIHLFRLSELKIKFNSKFQIQKQLLPYDIPAQLSLFFSSVYLSPPQLVKIVMSAVCILLQEKPDWATAKQVLSDQQFVNRLSTFDKNAVPEKVGGSSRWISARLQ